MTPKEFVLSNYPEAYSEKEENNITIIAHPCITVHIGNGNTEEEAWNSAKEYIDRHGINNSKNQQ